MCACVSVCTCECGSLSHGGEKIWLINSYTCKTLENDWYGSQRLMTTTRAEFCNISLLYKLNTVAIFSTPTCGVPPQY